MVLGVNSLVQPRATIHMLKKARIQGTAPERLGDEAVLQSGS